MFHKRVLERRHHYTEWTLLLPFSLAVLLFFPIDAYAAETGGGNMWAVGKELIVNLYNKIAGISTVLAALMSAVAVAPSARVTFADADSYPTLANDTEVTATGMYWNA